MLTDITVKLLRNAGAKKIKVVDEPVDIEGAILRIAKQNYTAMRDHPGSEGTLFSMIRTNLEEDISATQKIQGFFNDIPFDFITMRLMRYLPGSIFSMATYAGDIPKGYESGPFTFPYASCFSVDNGALVMCAFPKTIIQGGDDPSTVPDSLLVPLVTSIDQDRTLSTKRNDLYQTGIRFLNTRRKGNRELGHPVPSFDQVEKTAHLFEMMYGYNYSFNNYSRNQN